LPGGVGYSDGSFGNAGDNGCWWSATENAASSARGRYMFYDLGNVGWNYLNETYLCSVRCVQDN